MYAIPKQVALAAVLLSCGLHWPASAQLSAEQKAIYDAGYAKGEESGRKSCFAFNDGRPGSTSGVPIFSPPKPPGSSTQIPTPKYFLFQQSAGTGAVEFQKDAGTGAVTIRAVTPEALAKLFSDGKLRPIEEADHAAAMKDFLGLYEHQLKSLGEARTPAVGASQKR